MQVEFKVDQHSIDMLFRQVQKYGKSVSKQVERETAYAALEVEDKAKSIVPVDSGRLKGSITTQKVGGLAGASRFIRGMSSRITYLVGTNVNYARKVEFGSSEITTIKLTRGYTYTGTQKAKPFLRPAYREVIGGYKRTILRILRTAK